MSPVQAPNLIFRLKCVRLKDGGEYLPMGNKMKSRGISLHRIGVVGL
jgi:hypothetical protein